jgi:pyrroline-5-carboxylate reductase
MGGAMLRGWLEAGADPSLVTVIDPKPSAEISALAGERGFTVRPDADGITDAAVLVLAVKPQMLADAAVTLAPVMTSRPLVVSILAGKTVGDLSAALGVAPAGAPVVRSMPNTPSAVGRGITAGFAGPGVSAAQVDLTTALLEAVTALSGSGPAYVFWLTECMAAAGRDLGLPDDLAAALARATVSGAGELMHQASETPSTLRQNVTSPGGTTAAALEVLMAQDGLEPLMVKALTAARDRAREL